MGLTIFWARFNLIIGIYELYVYTKRDTLSYSNNFLIKLWKEYTISDNRYLDSKSYVWNFELVNAFLAGVFFFWRKKSILVLQVLNVLLYFATLRKGRIQNPKYLLVASVWLVLPSFLLSSQSF